MLPEKYKKDLDKLINIAQNYREGTISNSLLIDVLSSQQNFKENIALIRTRVKDDHLCIDTLTIGRRSKTIVSILSIKDIHNEKIRENLKKHLEEIDIDAIISIEDVMAYFQKKHLFPSYHYVGTPDTACRRLYNGEFILVIDRICIVVCLPTTLAYASRFKIDGINIPLFSFFERWFVLLSAIFSIFFCGLLAAFTTIQMDSLSLTVLSTSVLLIEGVKITRNSIFELWIAPTFNQNTERKKN